MGVNQLILIQSEAACYCFVVLVRFLGWRLGEVRLPPLSCVDFFVFLCAMIGLMGSVSLRFSCIFSFDLYFIWVGCSVVGFIGLQLVHFSIFGLVGSGHFARLGSGCFDFVGCMCWGVGYWFNWL